MLMLTKKNICSVQKFLTGNTTCSGAVWI